MQIRVGKGCVELKFERGEVKLGRVRFVEDEFRLRTSKDP